MAVSPILTRDGDVWAPAPEGKGPFAGQHGVAGAIAATMEGLAAERDAGFICTTEPGKLKSNQVECLLRVNSDETATPSLRLVLGDKRKKITTHQSVANAE